MTDVEVIRAMFDKAGVPFSEHEHVCEPYGRKSVSCGATLTTITVDADAPTHATSGYGGFAATLSFREDGSLHDIGAWE